MQIFFTILLWINMILGLTKCDSDFTYMKVDQNLISDHLQYRKIDLPGNAVSAEKYLPKSFSKSGKENYRVYLQKAIDENSVIVLPDFPVLIDKLGLKVKSGKIIIFQQNSQIIFAGPANGKYWDIIKIYNADNVKIINANVKGSRNSISKQSGEWSAGISILNSKNILIENPKISDTYGDGIFIGSEDFGFSENITVNGGFIDNVRRNGISINSAKNVFLNKILIANTNGTLPGAGVDLEPSIEQQVMENINLNNIYTFNNQHSGIAINMNYLSVDDPKNVKFVSINVDNHIDDNSPYAFATSLNDSKQRFDAKGFINVNNPRWNNNQDLYWKSNTNQSIMINFKNVKTSNLEKQKNLERFLMNQKNVSIK